MRLDHLLSKEHLTGKPVQDPDHPNVVVGAQMAETLASQSGNGRHLVLLRRGTVSGAAGLAGSTLLSI